VLVVAPKASKATDGWIEEMSSNFPYSLLQDKPHPFPFKSCLIIVILIFSCSGSS
jgi:hypothetical protein